MPVLAGPVYPLTLPGTTTSFAARDLAVAPGNDNQLAVDPGYTRPGVGILDISGSTDTMRPNLAGTYTGSNIAFPSPTIEGTGVAPDPVLGRVFFLGETLAGSANPVLLSFDTSRYVLLNMQQFTGAIQGMDLVRWGRDGLAWHTSNSGAFGNNTPGSGQLFLMRGPFVLPQWSTINPVPGLVSASPASATAASGNLNLAITGSNFVPGAILLWNGAERTTTFVDSSHLTVAIPASDLAKAGTATLVVNNPGSANSSSISFTIN